jgi:hypothetical protein
MSAWISACIASTVTYKGGRTSSMKRVISASSNFLIDNKKESGRKDRKNETKL